MARKRIFLLLATMVFAAPTPAQVIDLFTLDGTEGFRFEGIDEFDRAGISVRFLGDVNGDGTDDIAVGADTADPNGSGSGETYVVFGSPNGFPAIFDLSTLNGANGFTLNGISGDGAGAAVAGAIDFNGDGFHDVVIGADGNNSNPGHAYVIFGTDQSFPAVIELSSLNGTNGFALEGVANGDATGLSLDNTGDVNDDGFDDLIIGAISADPGGRTDAGQTYVIFGTDQGFPATFNLASLNGTNGFTIPGIDPGDRLGGGGGVSGAGDVNHDGIDDAIIGAHSANPGGRTNAGQAYVIFGTDQGFPATFDLASLNGTNGFTLNGISDGDFLSRVSKAGDVNHDGIGDILLGASGATPGSGRTDAGQIYVLFGTDQGFPAVFELSSLNGTNGFTLNGISGDDRAGAVGKAGDFNNDGIDDFLIGAPGSNANGDSAGQSYLIYGTDQGFPAVFELSSVDGSNGLIFNGFSEGPSLHRDQSGVSVDGGGDLNADGIDDLVIGAPSVLSNATNGRAYVVFGIRTTRYVAPTGSDTGNDCTDALNPCATLAHAVNQANNGNIINLAAGTYNEPGLIIDKVLTIEGQGVIVQ